MKRRRVIVIFAISFSMPLSRLTMQPTNELVRCCFHQALTANSLFTLSTCSLDSEV
jgi:hypothetical protein